MFYFIQFILPIFFLKSTEVVIQVINLNPEVNYALYVVYDFQGKMLDLNRDLSAKKMH